MDKKKSICKSLVWKYFNKKDHTSAACILCNKILKHGGNTTNLKQHLQRKHIFHVEHNELSENHQTIVDENIDEIVEQIVDENVDENVNTINFIDKQSSTDNMKNAKRNTKKRIYNEDDNDSSLSVSSCTNKHKVIL